MATTICSTDIRGRLGTYTLTMYDLTDTATPVAPFTVSAPVVLEFGEQGRDYPEQVLKSYVRLTVQDGATDLASIFTGSFDPQNYPVRIAGPEIDWTGFVVPEEQAQPFDSRVTRDTITLMVSGGLFLGDRTVESVFADPLSPARVLRDFFANGPESAESLGFSDEGLARFEGIFFDIFNLQTYDATSVRTSDDIEVVLRNTSSGTVLNPYESLVELMQLMRARVYRSASEGRVVMHPIRETGGGFEYAKVDEAGSRATVTRSALTTTIAADDVFAPFADAFQRLEAAGEIRVDLTDDYETIANVSGDYSLLRGGLTEVTVTAPGTQVVDEIATGTETPLLELNTDAGSTNIAEIEAKIGPIDPVDTLGIRVTWDAVNTGGGSESLTVEIDYNESFTDPVASETDGFNVFELTAPVDGDPKDIVVRFIGNEAEVRPRVQFLRDDRIVETLRVTSDTRALKPVEIGWRQPPVLIDGSLFAPIGSIYEWAPGLDTSLSGDGSSVSAASFRTPQPWLTSAFLESEYRPFGTLHLQTRVDGLYGPETALIVEKPDGTNGYFVCGTGRSLNLTQGTTRVSDIEIPSALLPTTLRDLL